MEVHQFVQLRKTLQQTVIQIMFRKLTFSPVSSPTDINQNWSNTTNFVISYIICTSFSVFCHGVLRERSKVGKRVSSEILAMFPAGSLSLNCMPLINSQRSALVGRKFNCTFFRGISSNLKMFGKHSSD